MAPRLLLDANISPRVAEALRSEGLDALHVAEIGLIAATDRQILEQASEDGRTVVTFDLDFAAMTAALGKAPATGVMILRLPSARPDLVLPRIRAALRREADALTNGAVVVVEPGRLRVRRDVR